MTVAAPGRPPSPAAGALFRRLVERPAFARLAAALEGRASPVVVSGLVEAGPALLLVLLQAGLGRPVLVVVPGEREAAVLRKDLQAVADLLRGEGARRRVLRFPALDADPYRGVAAHPQVACERVAVLHALEANEADLVVATARALTPPLPLPETFREGEVPVVPARHLDLERLARAAVDLGYRSVDTVTSPGEFCRRGGIVDVWPPHLERPRRIELFGDEVDSIRRFDPTTQRSLSLSGRFDLVPAQEIPLTTERAERLLRRLGSPDGPAEATGAAWGARLAGLREEGILVGAEACGRLLEPETATLFDHAVDAALVVIEPFRIEEELHQVLAEWTEAFGETGGGPLPGPEELFVPTASLLERLRAAAITLSELLVGTAPAAAETLVLNAQANRSYAGRAGELVRDLAAFREAGRRVLVFLRAKGSADRLAELLGERGLAFRRAERGAADRLEEAGATVDLVEAGLDRGVILPDARLVLLAEREVFGDPAPPPSPRRRRGGPFLSDFRDLQTGDHVVHVDHGIGRYLGLVRRGERELVLLEYRGDERLMVPTDRLDLLQKYNGAGGRPQLEKLGSGGFQKAKRRARKAVEDMSRQLLDLYARRKAQGGVAFGPDTPWQRELEESFPYELTPDQMRSVAEVKRDMESREPMDRLLCGDVGFGKTEVAVRAAFKAVQDGYQVAVLVPTTVLAFQHLNTVRARLSAFPVEVEMVSRFRSRAEIAEVLARAAAGRVDVLIGTHRLLSKDVAFRRLGLLIIDEEQRFGVRHKERLREIAVGVDTLALSATPIPRTLQMSLAGVRDISVIETPPRNRLAIQTHLLPYHPGVVASAIRNELRRGGQVYVVHHRVDSIDALAAHVKTLVPDARLAVAHGQMREATLERTMLEFVRGEADVLVSTTIIENGLDIPRVNTLLVNRADQYGLSQLYQMRGRVGRSDVQAYAYLLVPSRRVLTPLQRRRLLALQEFSELGSGFRVAARDLEIRGAGELLGARQHGHIAAIGFDLYARMLERAAREMREGVAPPEEEGISINLGLEHRLPESYVPEPGIRLQIYHRLSMAESREDLDGLRAELADRFGDPPPAARNLFRLAELRLLALSLGAVSLDWVDGALAVRFGPSPKVDTAQIARLVAADPAVSLTPAGLLRLRPPDPRADRIAAASLVLRRLAC